MIQIKLAYRRRNAQVSILHVHYILNILPLLFVNLVKGHTYNYYNVKNG